MLKKQNIFFLIFFFSSNLSSIFAMQNNKAIFDQNLDLGQYFNMLSKDNINEILSYVIGSSKSFDNSKDLLLADKISYYKDLGNLRLLSESFKKFVDANSRNDIKLIKNKIYNDIIKCLQVLFISEYNKGVFHDSRKLTESNTSEETIFNNLSLISQNLFQKDETDKSLIEEIFEFSPKFGTLLISKLHPADISNLNLDSIKKSIESNSINVKSIIKEKQSQVLPRKILNKLIIYSPALVTTFLTLVLMNLFINESLSPSDLITSLVSFLAGKKIGIALQVPLIFLLQYILRNSGFLFTNNSIALLISYICSYGILSSPFIGQIDGNRPFLEFQPYDTDKEEKYLRNLFICHVVLVNLIQIIMMLKNY